MRHTREFFIPHGSTKIADKQSDAVAYVYERDGKLYAAIFVGKQSKPLSHYRYRDAAKREASITEAFANNRAHAARKTAYKEDGTQRLSASPLNCKSATSCITHSAMTKRTTFTMR